MSLGGQSCRALICCGFFHAILQPCNRRAAQLTARLNVTDKARVIHQPKAEVATGKIVALTIRLDLGQKFSVNGITHAQILGNILT